MIFESSLSISNRHIGKILTHKHSGLLKSLNFNSLINLQQLNCVTHLAGRSVALVGFLNVELVGTQKAPGRHPKVVSETSFEGSSGSRGIQNRDILVHTVRHIAFAQADGFFKQAAISTSFPELFIGKCFRLIQIGGWQALEASTVHCNDE